MFVVQPSAAAETSCCYGAGWQTKGHIGRQLPRLIRVWDQLTAASCADIAEAGESVSLSVTVPTFGGGSVATMLTPAGHHSVAPCLSVRDINIAHHHDSHQSVLTVQGDASVSGGLSATTSHQTSDEKSKCNIPPAIHSDLSILEQLPMYWYNLKHDPDGQKQLGVLAHGACPLLPNSVCFQIQTRHPALNKSTPTAC